MKISLFFELEFVAFALLLLMLYNTFSLYRSNLRTPLSRLLLAGILLCITESSWEYLYLYSGNTFLLNLDSIVLGTVILFLYAFFLEFVSDDLLRRPDQRRITMGLIYFLPVLYPVVFFLVLFIDHGRYLNKALEIQTSYGSLLGLPYYAAAIIIACRVLSRSKKDSQERKEALDILAYILIAMAVAFVQSILWDEETLCSAITMTLPLCFLTIRRSTRSLVKREQQAAAAVAELSAAAGIQSSALPSQFPPYENHKDIDLYATLSMAKEVGGDFFDCFELDDRRVCFLIADVSGKGIPAALFMMKAKILIKTYSMIFPDTASIFSNVNNALCENNNDNMFATAWIGILDTETMLLQYTNAGHNYPCIALQGGDYEYLKDRHGLFLGAMSGIKYRMSEKQLSPGDALFLYTDGLSEAHDRQKQLFGEDRILNLLNENKDQNGPEILDRMKSAVDRYADGLPQFDDITMITVKIKQKG